MNYLTNLQKAAIARLARTAWERQSLDTQRQWAQEHGSFNKAFNAWRKVQQFTAVGVESLTEALSERDYLRLRAHFQDLAGDSGRALHTLLKHADEAQLRDLYLLEQACCDAGLSFPGYPAAICRQQFRCSLEAASSGQLRKLLFTVRNRGFAKKKRERQSAMNLS